MHILTHGQFVANKYALMTFESESNMDGIPLNI